MQFNFLVFLKSDICPENHSRRALYFVRFGATFCKNFCLSGVLTVSFREGMKATAINERDFIDATSITI